MERTSNNSFPPIKKNIQTKKNVFLIPPPSIARRLLLPPPPPPPFPPTFFVSISHHARKETNFFNFFNILCYPVIRDSQLNSKWHKISIFISLSLTSRARLARHSNSFFSSINPDYTRTLLRPRGIFIHYYYPEKLNNDRHIISMSRVINETF